MQTYYYEKMQKNATHPHRANLDHQNCMKFQLVVPSFFKFEIVERLLKFPLLPPQFWGKMWLKNGHFGRVEKGGHMTTFHFLTGGRRRNLRNPS
jgi:hypothetical protein